MKTKMNFIMSLLLVFSIAITSCSKDGDVGPAGSNGVAGTNGAAGTDGVDGADGVDGTDGAIGVDGTDGNANVQTYTYDISTRTGSVINVSTPPLIADVLENDGVLVYLKRGTSYYAIPGTSFDDEIKAALISSTVQLIFYDRSSGASVAVPAGRYELLKLIILESSNTTAGKKSSTKQTALIDLANAGVDANDYYAVCDYYGIAY